jgi:Uma2 family endonuclease
MATVASAPPEIEYPSSDGEPMAETPIHRDVMLDQIVTLKAHFADEPDVYVSGNMMMYYVEGNADKSVSPDVFVTLGIPKLPERDVYKLWVEGKGPDAVIEVTSKSTARVDQRRKFDLYRDVLKVQEYFMFDPREKTLAGISLCGYRLIDGEYELIPMTDGRLPSEVLGLHLETSGEQLRLYDPDRGVYLPTPAEIRETAAREAAAREAAEAQAAREAAEAQAAREAAAREAAAREAAEAQVAREVAAREVAEAEVERLRREIEALRLASGPSST